MLFPFCPNCPPIVQVAGVFDFFVAYASRIQVATDLFDGPFDLQAFELFGLFFPVKSAEEQTIGIDPGVESFPLPSGESHFVVTLFEHFDKTTGA